MAMAAAGIGLAPVGEAWGSGFQIRENSASALGNAFAGAAASTDDPSIIANNPAGMTGLSGNQVSGDMSIVIPSAVFSGAGFTAARQTISGGNGGDAGSAQPVPAAYGLYDVSADLKLGLAITAPFGLKTQYDSGWVGRYQAIMSDIETININPNIAYRVFDWLSVGGGPAIQHTHTELTNAINSTTVAHLANPFLPVGLTLPDGLASVAGNDWSVGYNLGLLAEVSPATRLGVSYRSQNQPSHRRDCDAYSPGPVGRQPSVSEYAGYRRPQDPRHRQPRSIATGFPRAYATDRGSVDKLECYQKSAHPAPRRLSSE